MVVEFGEMVIDVPPKFPGCQTTLKTAGLPFDGVAINVIISCSQIEASGLTLKLTGGKLLIIMLFEIALAVVKPVSYTHLIQ